MTRCPSHDGGGHPFPYEDDDEAYCAEHEVRLVRHRHVALWRGAPITDDDLAPTAIPEVAEE